MWKKGIFLILNSVVSLGFQNVILSLLYLHWGPCSRYPFPGSSILMSFQSLLIPGVLEETVKCRRHSVCTENIPCSEKTISWLFLSEDPSLLWLSTTEFLCSFRAISTVEAFLFQFKKGICQFIVCQRKTSIVQTFSIVQVGRIFLKLWNICELL